MAWTAPPVWASAVLTSAQMNTYVTDNENFLKTNIALEAATELTIAAGVITKTKGYHDVDTQADAAEDDLDTINGGAEGEVIFLRAENAARTVICKHGTGNLDLRGNDIYLTDTDQILVLMHDGTNWVPVAPPNLVQEFMVNAFQYPNTGADWVPSASGASLPATRAGVTCWLPLNFLKIGDQILSYKLVGDATETNAITLDCKLVSVNLADPLTTTDVAGGAIAQVDADGNFDVLATLTAAEVIATDKQYYLEILGTTGVADAILVMGAEVKVIRL